MDKDLLIKMKSLIDEINYHRQKYYDEDNNVISDKEYDALYDELVELEKQSGIVLDNSPTKLVGGKASKNFLPYMHKQKLYSLDKCQSFEEFTEWQKRVEKQLVNPEYTLEYKYDGLSVNLYYLNGLLEKASTRGDGSVGEDITEQILTIKEIPRIINFKGELEIQGECIMRISDFNEYNRKSDKPLKNPRNAAAGALRNLDIEETKKRKLTVFFYNIGFSKDKEFKSQEEIYNFLKENNFNVGDYFEVIKSKEWLFEELKNIDAVKSTLDYLIDGAVIKVNKISDRKLLGFTEKFPKWAIAYKFKPEEATTVLKDVKWQVSRTGKINPLAILEPIELCGATIKRATLNNMADIKKKDIKINSRVFIRRSNEVIPEVIASAEHYKNSIDIEPPKSCPVCGGEVVKKGAFYYCTNKDDCATRIISELSHFASKEAMDIEGLSDKTCELLYNELNVKNFDDIYKLNKSQLMELEGFKERKADNLLASIEKSKNISLERFITALGINNIGKKNAKTLAQNFKDIQKIINANKEELLKLKDFGEIMAESVVEYFKNGEKLKVVNNLLNFITFNEETNANSGIFNGKVVLITGKLESMKRGSAHQEIIKRGGSIAEDMTKSVNLLICGDKPGSKLVKAEKAGVEIIDEKKFLDLLNSSQTIE